MAFTYDKTNRKRRWLSFSLRTLLLLFTVVCLSIGWLAHRALNQRKSVEWVREAGGIALYGFTFTEDGLDPDAKPPVPAWLVQLVGIDYFSKVRNVILEKGQVNDISPLAGLTRVRALRLRDNYFSDIRPLESFEHLKFLDISNSEVSDVRPLANLTGLSTLFLSNTEVRDVTPLAKLTNLKELRILNSHVTKEDYETLKRALPRCRIWWQPRKAELSRNNKESRAI